MNSYTRKLALHDVRIHDLIWVPAVLVGGDDLPEVFTEDFMESLPDDPGAQLFRRLPKLGEALFSSDEYLDPEVAASLLEDMTGFLVRPETPSRRYEADGDTFTISWGNTRWEWLYATDVADLERVCIAWAETKHQEMARAAKDKAQPRPQELR